jgi:hypothetical protein
MPPSLISTFHPFRTGLVSRGDDAPARNTKRKENVRLAVAVDDVSFTVELRKLTDSGAQRRRQDDHGVDDRGPDEGRAWRCPRERRPPPATPSEENRLVPRTSLYEELGAREHLGFSAASTICPAPRSERDDRRADMVGSPTALAIA